MAILVTDEGFAPDDWRHGYVPLAALSDAADGGWRLGIDLRSAELSPRDWQRLRAALPRCGMIRLRLRHFGDTEALELAERLRAAGYRGRLRAHGAVLARFYTLARRAGFSEVELDRHQAQRQPREHWRFFDTWAPEGIARSPFTG
ncbi:DUF934 domain-containing protein [Pararhodobacter oceanensis]|uniref:DUF934 domain-containing protein n=1 Tax=Pararhodobacter oceanensis TaxID=2172121 RepID=UPI003A95B8BB